MLLILFGLSGAGKNFVGTLLEKEFGFYYWDADTEIPQSIQEQILKKDVLTQAMRNELTEIIIKKIADLKKHYSNIAVSQALYKEKNRNQIASIYPDAKFLQIKASREKIIDRLQQRNDWIDQTYAEKMSHHFEEPQKPNGIIINNDDANAVILQLRDFFLNNKKIEKKS